MWTYIFSKHDISIQLGGSTISIGPAFCGRRLAVHIIFSYAQLQIYFILALVKKQRIPRIFFIRSD